MNAKEYMEEDDETLRKNWLKMRIEHDQAKTSLGVILSQKQRI